MLQNRNLRIVLVYLVIAITHSEPYERNNQGQNHGRVYNQRQLNQHERPNILAERQNKAREMLKYMNSEADTCKNFYDFACGNWLQEQDTDMANEGDLVSVQTEMERVTNRQLQTVLSEPVRTKDSVAARVAKDFYQLCLRVPASSPNQRQFIRRFVMQNGGSPDIEGTGWKRDYDWVNVVADLRRNYNMDILIGLTIDKSTKNNLYFLEEPKSALLPAELCSSLATPEIEKNYQVFDKIQNEIKENLKNWFQLHESNALRIAGSIIRFEFDLCKHMRLDEVAAIPQDDEADQQNLYSNRRGEQPPKIVENKFHGVTQDTSQQSFRSLYDRYKIEFRDFIDKNKIERGQVRVYLRSEEYFQQLSKIVSKGLQASFANYILYRALSEITFPLNERTDQRPFYCTGQVMRYLPQVLGKLYSEKLFNEEAQQAVQNIYSDIKDVFSNDYEKSQIKSKVDSIQTSYASYPSDEDMSRDLPLHDRDYWHKLQTIMMNKANQTIEALQIGPVEDRFPEAPVVTIQKKSNIYELVVGTGLLQKPFYSQFYSKALQYSSLGVAMAREIVNRFSDQDLQQHPLNTFPSDPSALEGFAESSECFRAQISNYLHNNRLDFRNATKLREIMVETSALNIAFSAYLNWLEKTTASPRFETLPDINFTNTQLFFINYAQTRCAARKQVEVAPEYLPLYRRTLEQYDINGPLSNNVEFARDFNCELGSDMNLDDKCAMLLV